MDDKLKKKIKLLLTNAAIKASDNKVSNYTLTEDAGRYPLDDSTIKGLIDDNPEDWQLNNQHSGLLIKLSQQLSARELKEFEQLLLSYIENNGSDGIVDAVTLYFVHTGNTGILLDHICKTLVGYNNNGACVKSILCIIQALRHRPDIFGSDITERLLDYADDYMQSRSKLGQDADEYSSLYTDVTKALRRLYITTNEMLTRDFARQIDTAFNPELNADEARVVEQIESIGFPLDLSESLRHISDLVEQANTPMKYRDCMSAIRAFTERFYEQVAKSIDPATKIDGKDAEKAAKFFKEKRLLSTDMADLLMSHRHFLSNDGTHRIKSRREDARIAKNMTIEISLYVITRLRELQES
ncbi:hypothetical protein IPL85_00825 [Candidatus Saccharibacteria bacterium]|nr:MAG: hypothetical protein IPL85_00825 [Candidatus Saccharibacteria bacterium]